MKILLDTNILLDVLHDRKPFAESAAKVWKLVEEGTAEGYVSAISFNNIYYVARKRDGFAKALDALRIIRANFRIVPLDETIIDRALAVSGSDFEDAIQAAAAVRVVADYLVTRNVKDFGTMGANAITADDFILIMEP